ncbi:MAG: hypothetical protein ACYTAN_02240 [Planctomycetota bacterium]|jgi:hypothetical protein
MVNRFTLVLSTVFWLLMMALLFKVDILPNYIVEDDPGYESIIRRVEAPVIRTMAVLQDGVEVGGSQTVITPEIDGSYVIANVTTLKVKVGFIESRVSAVLNVNLDKERQLTDLYLDIDMGTGQRAELTGTRKGDKLLLEMKLAGETLSEEIPYDNAIIASYFNPFPLGARLKVGQSWRTKFLDPLSQKSRSVVVKVVGKETIELSTAPGRPAATFETYKIVTDWQGAELAAWATEDGVILREQTPLGYTLEYRENPGQ